ncbi:MAG: cupin domain-containing protein [Burkholderiaceae bacterium]
MNTTLPHEDRAVLDAGIIEALDSDPVQHPIDAASAARIKHRVLERIAQAQAGHVTVHPGEAGWKPLHRGVEIKVLHRAGDVMSYLLRLAPGATLAAHRHPIDEECVVLEGRLRIGDELVVDAGGFHLAHQDALHAEITSDAGATIYLRGAAPHPNSIV